MKIINNDFYTNNWHDFVHQWVIKKVDNLVQRYDLPVDVDTIESFRIQTNEVGTHDFVFDYTKDGVEHTLTITPKNDDVEISISDNSTWVVNGEDTGKNTAGLMGPVGERGIQGEQGDKGTQGVKGKTGIQGPKGERGETGDKGKPGDIGETGVQGLQGEVGLQGERGERGEAGPQGKKGLQGEQGLQGEIGDKGPQGIPGTITGGKGPAGPVGLKGETGDKGPTGSKGPQGVIGETGDKGPQGDRGEQGPQGDQGPKGLQGPIGDKGEKGDTGHQPEVSIGENEDFYIDGEDTDKPSRGEAGKLTGVNKDNYVTQIYDTIGHKENDVYSCLNDSSFLRNYGPIDSYEGSDTKTNYIIPTRSDENFHGLNSTPYDKIKLFSNASTKIIRKSKSVSEYSPSSIGIYGIPLGINCMSQLTGGLDYTNYSSSWVYFNGSPFYLNNNDILSGLSINDYNKWEFMMKAFTMGIIKFTDEKGNVRTFQCCGILHRYVSSGSGSGFRYCPVLRQYKKGPQAQWSNTFTKTGNYDVKVEIIDNDGNQIDFENGGLITSHDVDYFTSLWATHKDEMNV